MTRLAVLLASAAFALPHAARAQDDLVWVQLEAQRTLAGAQAAARGYAGEFSDVSGHALGGGWYGISIGPYPRDDAEQVLRRLRNAGLIPRDAFLNDGGNYRRQFWPVGAEGTARPASPPDGPGTAATAGPVQAAAEPDGGAPEETLSEARASEARLSRAERERLQVALRWAGFYDGPIDAAFGRGTRSAMAGWQQDRGADPTGVLTSRQRAALLDAYDAVLDGMDLAVVRDDRAGIAVEMPTGVVAFDRYDAPFAKYEATGEVPARVLLISQPGDEDRFLGFYEILQTLEIVPRDGPRSRDGRSFEIEGADDTRHTYATATLENGRIKGFVLVWPADDEERRSRVLQRMTASFTRLPGVLDPAEAPPERQAVDLLAGLQVRQPELSRSGFYIDGEGLVLTTSEIGDGCEEITIDGAHGAEVALADPARGFAVLRPEAPLSPLRVAQFRTDTPRLQAQVAVAGYPYGGLFAAPALTFGTLADLRGLDGEEELKRLALPAEPGDAGGPLLDAGGAVLGMVLPADDGGSRVLPPDVAFATDATAIVASLEAAGLPVETTLGGPPIAAETLTLRASEMTVLIDCW